MVLYIVKFKLSKVDLLTFSFRENTHNGKRKVTDCPSNSSPNKKIRYEPLTHPLLPLIHPLIPLIRPLILTAMDLEKGSKH
jgi:hypothetical protein